MTDLTGEMNANLHITEFEEWYNARGPQFIDIVALRFAPGNATYKQMTSMPIMN